MFYVNFYFIIKKIQLKYINLKKIYIGLSRKSGRNNQGKIVSYHRGAGIKFKYKRVDYLRNYNSFGVVLDKVKSMKHTSELMLVYFFSKKICYMLLTQNIKIGDLIFSGENLYYLWVILKYWFLRYSIFYTWNLDQVYIIKKLIFKIGNTLPLYIIPLQSLVCNIELKYLNGGKVARSAGLWGTLIDKDSKNIYIKLKSKFIIFVWKKCLVTLGQLSNSEHNEKKKKKAGVNRKLNRRPKVRGVAMNPVDHPHGGGEGKTSGGRPSVTPWGKITKGKPTVKKYKRNLLKYKYIKLV